jgi:hypothetical protein
VLDRLARNNHVEGIICKGQALGVTVNKRGKMFAAPVCELRLCRSKRRERKITTRDARAAPRQFPNEPAPSTRNLQHAQSSDNTDLFAH